MMVSKKIRQNEKQKLKGALRKCGFDRWRLVTNGVSNITGEEKTFFIEFYCVNPSLSPKSPILGFKNRFDNNMAADIQFALAGTDAAKNFTSQMLVNPSFYMVRAGTLSTVCRQFNNYYSEDEVDYKSDEVIVAINTTKEKEQQCILGENNTRGFVCVTEADLVEHPEYMGNAGSMSWNLAFTREIAFEPDYCSKEINWCVPGGKADFNGTIIFNDEEFNVTERNSFGYYDKNWGKDFSSPFFHLSSSFITSQISGKLLQNSAVVVQGEYNDKLTVLVCLEGEKIEFHADKRKKYNVIHDCQEITDDDMGPKLHWSCSVNNKKYVIDIDVYCRTKDLFLRDYESPAGERKVMRVLSSGTGTGKMKIYKVVKKSLELIEQTEIKKCICEYGNLEKAEE
ncbi:MAG: hypothetical protein KBS64_05380 [Treponema sp.]|nr:hypothetical protein [Candidatus Treponema equi]